MSNDAQKKDSPNELGLHTYSMSLSDEKFLERYPSDKFYYKIGNPKMVEALKEIKEQYDSQLASLEEFKTKELGIVGHLMLRNGGVLFELSEEEANKPNVSNRWNSMRVMFPGDIIKIGYVPNLDHEEGREILSRLNKAAEEEQELLVKRNEVLGLSKLMYSTRDILLTFYPPESPPQQRSTPIGVDVIGDVYVLSVQNLHRYAYVHDDEMGMSLLNPVRAQAVQAHFRVFFEALKDADLQPITEDEYNKMVSSHQASQDEDDLTKALLDAAPPPQGSTKPRRPKGP